MGDEKNGKNQTIYFKLSKTLFCVYVPNYPKYVGYKAFKKYKKILKKNIVKYTFGSWHYGNVKKNTKFPPQTAPLS